MRQDALFSSQERNSRGILYCFVLLASLFLNAVLCDSTSDEKKINLPPYVSVSDLSGCEPLLNSNDVSILFPRTCGSFKFSGWVAL